MPLDDHILFDTQIPATAIVIVRGGRAKKPIAVMHDASIAISHLDQAKAPVALRIGDGSHAHQRSMLRSWAGELWRPFYITPNGHHSETSVELVTLKMLLKRQLTVDGMKHLIDLGNAIPLVWDDYREVIDSGRAAAEKSASDLTARFISVEGRIYERIAAKPVWRLSTTGNELTLLLDLPASTRRKHGPACLHFPLTAPDIFKTAAAIAQAMRLTFTPRAAAAMVSVDVPSSVDCDPDELLRADVTRLLYDFAGGAAWASLPDLTINALIDVRMMGEAFYRGEVDLVSVLEEIERLTTAVVAATPSPRTHPHKHLVARIREGSRLLSAFASLASAQKEAA